MQPDTKIREFTSVLLLAPGPADSDALVGAPSVATGAAEGPFVTDFESILPESFGGQFESHLIPIEQYCNDLQMLYGVKTFDAERAIAQYREKDGITHIALLEGRTPMAGHMPYSFGKDTINAVALVMAYDEVAQKFRYLHCPQCAVDAMNWIIAMQEEWDRAQSFGYRPQSHSFH